MKLSTLAKPAILRRKLIQVWHRAVHVNVPVTVEFLRSPEYRGIMSRYLDSAEAHDPHEAQNETASFLFRHHNRRHQLGIFRWRGIQQNLDDIVPLVSDPARNVIDLGGAACPLGFSSKIVDLLEKDSYGQPVPYKSLDDVPGPVHVIFSSHTLEHIPDLDRTLRQIADKLDPDGRVILHLPAYTCERWRPGTHANQAYGDHVWCFGLSTTRPEPEFNGYTPIDTRIARFLNVVKAEYCGDDGILIIATKNKPTPTGVVADTHG